MWLGSSLAPAIGAAETLLLCVVHVGLLQGDGEATGDGSESHGVDVVVRVHKGERGVGQDWRGERDGSKSISAEFLLRCDRESGDIVPRGGFIHGGLNGGVNGCVGHDVRREV
jgi:hypothetical protein